MKKSLCLFLGICGLTLTPACVATNITKDQEASLYFDVQNKAGFSPVQPALQAYLAQHNAKSGGQNICVIGYSLGDENPADKMTSDRAPVAWVYWKEGQRLTYWGAAAPGFASKDTLLRSPRDLDLETDVVATLKDVGSSTYLVSSDWVKSIQDNCIVHGESYHIIMP